MMTAVVCSFVLSACLLFAHGEPTVGAFSPMFLRGQPVWVTRVSRRQLLLDVAERDQKPKQEPATEVAVILL